MILEQEDQKKNLLEYRMKRLSLRQRQKVQKIYLQTKEKVNKENKRANNLIMNYLVDQEKSLLNNKINKRKKIQVSLLLKCEAKVI